jgi:hypothetical protein
MSSLLYLGVSIVAFFLTFGFLAMLTPMIFGLWFSVMDTFEIENQAWSNIYDQHKLLVELLVPIIFSLGIVVAVLKVFMGSTNKGRD